MLVLEVVCVFGQVAAGQIIETKLSVSVFPLMISASSNLCMNMQ